jgi:hypothetical protein
LVSLASWAREPVRVRLKIDWKALGLDPEKAHLFAPAIPGFQGTALFRPSDDLPVTPGRGWLLLLDEQPRERPAPMDAYAGREVLLEDRFDRDQLGDPWKVFLSPQPGTALKVENGALAIEAVANGFAFAERPLPPGATLVECRVYSGTDQGATWGPGLALRWPDKALRINLRAEGRFGVDDGANFTFGGFVAPESWYHLRLRLEENEIVAEASGDEVLWETLQTFPRPQFPGDPVTVRLGKTGPGGRDEDFSTPGPVGSCALKDLRAWRRKQ